MTVAHEGIYSMKKVRPYQSLYEIAFSKNKIENAIISVQPQITEHIVKLLLFPHSTRNHRVWSNSIYKHVINIADMKWEKNNGYLKLENYFKYFFEAPFENDDEYKHLDNIVKEVIHEYKDLKPKYSLSDYPKMNWITRIKDFYHEVSKLISEGNEDWSVYEDGIRHYFIEQH